MVSVGAWCLLETAGWLSFFFLLVSQAKRRLRKHDGLL